MASQIAQSEQEGGVQVDPVEVETYNPLDPDFWDPVVRKFEEIGADVVTAIPNVFVGAIAFFIAYLIARYVLFRLLREALETSGANAMVVDLVSSIARIGLIFLAALFALSAAGLAVGSLLGGLAILGLAAAFAVQDIGENLISGLLLSIRRPFETGDQIISGDYEGTVEDIDLRATTLVDYDGELIVIPNKAVYSNALLNLTARGRRRTRVGVGVGYQDDLVRARGVILGAVGGVPGVLDDPEPQALLTGLGDSSVDFEVRYWTAPDIGSVRRAQDRVIEAIKTSLDEAGIDMPWPIRTLKFDTPLELSSPESS